MGSLALDEQYMSSSRYLAKESFQSLLNVRIWEPASSHSALSIFEL